MANSQVIEIAGDNWKTEVLGSPVPVLVDFWGDWCNPCKALVPILDELSVEMAGTIKIVKVNVAENRELATKHGVRNLPCLLVLKGGQVKGQMGAMNKSQFKEKLATYL